MAYYKKRTYRRRKKSSFYNVFSKYHSCKWKKKYNSLQKQLRDEWGY